MMLAISLQSKASRRLCARALFPGPPGSRSTACCGCASSSVVTARLAAEDGAQSGAHVRKRVARPHDESADLAMHPVISYPGTSLVVMTDRPCLTIASTRLFIAAVALCWESTQEGWLSG